ncbi:MAG TPA: TIR domain-containing protein, partial [Polyangiaceae bacterium]|nr:TIR domain-containing protein [Polyangiaceae bacterium]
MVHRTTQAWDCFIAYPGGQRAFAEELANMLSGRLRVFFDRRSLQPGDNWAKAIVSALESTYVTIVIVSPETDRAYYEQEEIQRALARARGSDPTRRVVPIFVGGTTPDDADIPYGLRLKQGFTVGSSQELSTLADKIAGLVEEIRDRVALEEDGEEPRQLSAPIREHLATLKIVVDRLTHDQYRVINQLRYMHRVRISGSAGSGKTLVGVEKAIRIARAGARVLFLCHNPLLSEHVQQLTAGAGVNVRDFAEWVNDLAGVVCGPNGREWTHYDEPVQATLAHAFEALASDALRYDAIIVDEGQDFREEWWTLVEAALADAKRGSLYLFHDNNQSLLAHRSSYPVSEPHVDMSRNCRNAGRVLDLMRCFDSSAPEVEFELRSH